MPKIILPLKYNVHVFEYVWGIFPHCVEFLLGCRLKSFVIGNYQMVEKIHMLHSFFQDIFSNVNNYQ